MGDLCLTMLNVSLSKFKVTVEKIVTVNMYLYRE